MDGNSWNPMRLLALGLVLPLLFSLTAMGTPVLAAETDSADVFSEAQELAEEADASGTDYNGYIFQLKSGVMTTLDVDCAEGVGQVDYAARMYTAESLEQIEELVPDSVIAYIEPNYMLKLHDLDADSVTAPNDKYYLSGDQWNLDLMKVQEAWAYGIEGQDLDDTVDMNYDGSCDNDPIVIAVIDSGLKAGHEDIDWSRIVPGKNFNPYASSTDDVLGHGTFVTGLIMAAKDNDIGIAGIAQNVYVMPLKVFQQNSVETSVIISAISYAVEQKTLFDSSGGTQGTNISVINMSLGGEENEKSLQTAVESAIDAGIIVICSAGNDGDTTASYPAQYAIGVGSVDKNGVVSYFSQRLSVGNGTGYENKVWVVAPGENVTSLYYTSTNAYYTASGTSFSSPEVAALAAICKGLDNSLDHDGFKQLLKETSTPKSGSSGSVNGQDAQYGWGLVNFAAAVESIAEVSGPSTVTVEVKNEAGSEIPDAQYAIYTVTDDDARGELVAPNADGTYTLVRGQRYWYEASADKYDAQCGVFAVLTAERTLTITLEGQTYYTRFVGWNTRGEIIPSLTVTVTRSDGVTITRNANGSFDTRNGEYRYTAVADGYFESSGTFVINDLIDDTLPDGKYINVLLYDDLDVCTMTINILDENGGDIGSGAVMTLKNSAGETVETYTDGTYKLPPDTYTYTAEYSSYKTVTGGFVIVEAAKGTSMSRNIYMTDKLYNVYLDVMPLTVVPTITVFNGLGEVEAPAGGSDPEEAIRNYRLPTGTYRYRVEANYYNTYVGTFTVTGTKQSYSVDIQMVRGSEIVDDGTWGENTYLTVGSSYYSLAELQKYPTTADYTIGGASMSVTGITITDVIEYFTTNPQQPTGVTVTTEDGAAAMVKAESFDSAMIAWSVPGGEGLGLTVDGNEAVIWNPTIVTVDYHEHNLLEESNVPATCTEAGVRQSVCIECGEMFTEVIPALGHDFVNGVCSRCGEWENGADHVSITVNGVSVTVQEMRQYTTSAYYTMVGYSGSSSHYVVGILLSDLVEHFIGDVCVSGLTITAADMQYPYLKSVFPDAMIAWSIDGVSPGSYASDNGLRVVVNNGASASWMYSPLIVTAGGGEHTYLEEVVPPTCISQGYTTKTCSVCGHTEISDYIPATGEHKFELAYILTPASCVTDGQGVYSCVNCGMNEVMAIPAAGHQFENGVCVVCGEEAPDVAIAVQNLTVPMDGTGQPTASVTAPENGWLRGENTFTVTSGDACVVLVSGADGVYTRLTAAAVEGSENTYCFTVGNVTEETVITVLLAGDANCDGEVNSADVRLMQRAFLGETEISELGAIAAELAGNDGRVNSLDILQVLAALVKTRTLPW